MANRDTPVVSRPHSVAVAIVRHKEVCQRLQISSAKLFDMVAKGLFPKPFQIIPNGRATGWLESDVQNWILNRSKGGV